MLGCDPRHYFPNKCSGDAGATGLGNHALRTTAVGAPEVKLSIKGFMLIRFISIS